MKLPSVFGELGEPRKIFLPRQQGQGRLSGSIGYLLSHLGAPTTNILVHNTVIAIWIAWSYFTSFRDRALLNIYNFPPVNLPTRWRTDKGHQSVCVSISDISVLVRSVNMCSCVSFWEFHIKTGYSFFHVGSLKHNPFVFLFSFTEILEEMRGQIWPQYFTPVIVLIPKS